MLLNTWLRTAQGAPGKAEKRSRAPKTAELPPICRLLTAQHGDRDPAWQNVGQGERTILII